MNPRIEVRENHEEGCNDGRVAQFLDACEHISDSVEFVGFFENGKSKNCFYAS